MFKGEGGKPYLTKVHLTPLGSGKNIRERDVTNNTEAD